MSRVLIGSISSLICFACQCVRGEAEVFNKHLAKLRRIGVGGRNADEAIHLAAIERLGVVDGAHDAVAEFVDPIGQYRDAPFARRPIARGQIVQHLCQPVLLQSLAQHGLFDNRRETDIPRR